MKPITLKDEAVADQDTELQRLHRPDEAELPVDTVVHSYYYRIDAPCPVASVLPPGHRSAVVRYDPKDWPFGPESDYTEEWESGEA